MRKRRSCSVAVAAAGLLTLVLSLLPSVQAATIPVSDVGAFQAALTTAAANGEDDIIIVAAGTYLLSSPLSYSSSEAHSLQITGAGVAVTILDGGNPAQHRALALTSTGSGAALTVEHLTLRDGMVADGIGGALYMESAGALALDHCEVLDSSATGAIGDIIGGGAALISSGGDIDVTDSFFRRNHSDGNVGGLFANAPGTVTISGCVFEDNTVTNLGGSEYFGDGGGAQVYGGEGQDGQVVRVSGCTFSGNTVSGGSNPDGGGLMVYQNGLLVSTELTGNSFTGNQAGNGGGGLMVRVNASGSLSCTGNTFTDNHAIGASGGGAHVHIDTGTLIVAGNTFTGNQAGGNGGGLECNQFNGSASLSGNYFASNAADENGGGLQLTTNTAVTDLSGAVFSANTAGNVGAGMSYATDDGDLSLASSSFSANVAGGEGGAMYLYLETPTAPVSLDNLILWGDSPDELAFSTGTGSASLTLRYSDVAGGSAQPWFGAGCIEADPLFVSAATGDLRLSWASFPVVDATRSPCIDSGDPALPLDPDGTEADMGALPYSQNAAIFADGFELGSSASWSLTQP